MIMDHTFLHSVRVVAVDGRCERLDGAFLRAFRAAAQGWPEPLDVILRSRLLTRGEREMLTVLEAMLQHGTPLGPGEREMLDQLDCGELRPVGGRGGALSPDEQRRCAARYLAGGSNESVMVELVTETGMDRTTILGWVRPLRSTLQRAPDPDLVLRAIIDPYAEAAAIRARVDAANFAVLENWPSEPEQAG
jgi:hypothetical protein